MPMYEFARKGTDVKLTIEADDYDVTDTTISFIKDGQKLFTVLVAQLAYVALLDDSGKWAFNGNVKQGF